MVRRRLARQISFVRRAVPDYGAPNAEFYSHKKNLRGERLLGIDRLSSTFYFNFYRRLYERGKRRNGQRAAARAAYRRCSRRALRQSDEDDANGCKLQRHADDICLRAQRDKNQVRRAQHRVQYQIQAQPDKLNFDAAQKHGKHAQKTHVEASARFGKQH